MAEKAEKRIDLQQIGARNERIIALWEAGRKRGFIANVVGVTPNAVMGVVFRWQQRSGKGRRRDGYGRTWTDAEMAEAERLLRAGMQWAEVASAMNVERESLKQAYYRHRKRRLAAAKNKA